MFARAEVKKRPGDFVLFSRRREDIEVREGIWQKIFGRRHRPSCFGMYCYRIRTMTYDGVIEEVEPYPLYYKSLEGAVSPLTLNDIIFITDALPSRVDLVSSNLISDPVFYIELFTHDGKVFFRLYFVPHLFDTRVLKVAESVYDGPQLKLLVKSKRWSMTVDYITVTELINTLFYAEVLAPDLRYNVIENRFKPVLREKMAINVASTDEIANIYDIYNTYLEKVITDLLEEGKSKHVVFEEVVKKVRTKNDAHRLYIALKVEELSGDLNKYSDCLARIAGVFLDEDEKLKFVERFKSNLIERARIEYLGEEEKSY